MFLIDNICIESIYDYRIEPKMDKNAEKNNNSMILRLAWKPNGSEEQKIAKG